MSRQQIFEASLDYFLAPIGALLADESVTEIMVNGHDEVYVERRGRVQPTDIRFASDDALRSAVHNIAQWVGREIDAARPILDARLPDGSRVHAVIPPSAKTGTYVTIRRFSRERLTLDDLIGYGSLNPAAREFLQLCVRLRKNVIVAGGTGTGKTSLMNALSEAIPADERIVVIEDTSELRLAQPHTLYLEAQTGNAAGAARIGVRQLFVASLRMRPDRIIVGEVRGGEALDLIQSMLSGHSGSLSTVHANTPRDALIRLETLSLMSDVDIPVYVARAQVASAIDLVVQLSRIAADGSRRVTRIAEVGPLDTAGAFDLKDLFVAHYATDDAGALSVDLRPTGTPPSFAAEVREQGLLAEVSHSAAVWNGTADSA